LIESAIQDAIIEQNEFRSKLGRLCLKLDRDTRDQAGSPAIEDLLVAKIEKCETACFDITPVHDNGHSNPNVMLELGMAAKHLGWHRVILVLNRHYLPAVGHSKLPFDIRNRNIAAYNLAPNADEKMKHDQRMQLSKTIEDRLSCMDSGGGSRDKIERVIQLYFEAINRGISGDKTGWKQFMDCWADRIDREGKLRNCTKLDDQSLLIEDVLCDLYADSKKHFILHVGAIDSSNAEEPTVLVYYSIQEAHPCNSVLKYWQHHSSFTVNDFFHQFGGEEAFCTSIMSDIQKHYDLDRGSIKYPELNPVELKEKLMVGIAETKIFHFAHHRCVRIIGEYYSLVERNKNSLYEGSELEHFKVVTCDKFYFSNINGRWKIRTISPKWFSIEKIN